MSEELKANAAPSTSGDKTSAALSNALSKLPAESSQQIAARVEQLIECENWVHKQESIAASESSICKSSVAASRRS